MELMQNINHRLLFMELPLHFAAKRLLLKFQLAHVCALDFGILSEEPCPFLALYRATARLDPSFVTLFELEQCLDLWVAPHLLPLRRC
jgi:hypothetical protein